MPVRDEARRPQRSLAALDAAHLRSTTRLDQAGARRAEVMAEADLTAAAQESVEAAVAGMAPGFGVELTAQMLGAVHIARGLAIEAQGSATPAGSNPQHADKPAPAYKPGPGSCNQRRSAVPAWSSHRPVHHCRAGVPSGPEPGWRACK